MKKLILIGVMFAGSNAIAEDDRSTFKEEYKVKLLSCKEITKQACTDSFSNCISTAYERIHNNQDIEECNRLNQNCIYFQFTSCIKIDNRIDILIQKRLEDLRKNKEANRTGKIRPY